MSPNQSNSIDWAGIRAAAVTVGVREAARQAARDLPPDEQKRFVDRVMQRSAREGWIKQKTAIITSARASAVENGSKPLSASVSTGADAIAESLAEDSNATKTGFSRMARRVAEAAGNYKAPKVLKNARALRDVATIAGQVHGWDAKTGEDRRVMINIGILTQ